MTNNAAKFGNRKFSDYRWGDADTVSDLTLDPQQATVANEIVVSADPAPLNYSALQPTVDNLLTVSADTAKIDYDTILPILLAERVLPPFDLTSVGIVEDTVVRWQETVSSSQDIRIEASLDGGNTWNSVNNGGSIPGLSQGQVVLGDELLIRQVLQSDDTSTTPTLEYAEVVVRSQLDSKGQ